ncbi:MAG: hypothetical protein ACI85I_002108 [Arenicella sp.]|jgi:hypothetical protein
MDKSTKYKIVNNRNIVLAITILVLVAFNVIQLFINRRSESVTKEKYETKQMELVNTYAKLDTISSQLDERIEHIRRLGGSVDSLIEVKHQLEQDKYSLRQSIHLASNRYEQIKGKVEGYEKLLAMKDKEISEMEHLTKVLTSEKLDLLEKQDELADEVTQLKSEKDKLLEQMSQASVLAIEDIRFFAVAKNGISGETTLFKQNKFEKLKVSIQLEDNQFAKEGKKEIMMRIIEPSGACLYNTNSGTFKYKGKQIFYTNTEEFIFNNNSEKIDFNYDKSNEYAIGTHRVEFYCEGFKIGDGEFEVE